MTEKGSVAGSLISILSSWSENVLSSAMAWIGLEAFRSSEISWPEIWLAEAGDGLLRGDPDSLMWAVCLFSELLHNIVNIPNS